MEKPSTTSSTPMATHATLLFVLGMIDRVSNLADAGEDVLERRLEEERLPRRIRLPSKKIATTDETGAN